MPGQARVLLAEDEPDMLRMTGARIRRAGYEVLEAEDGAAALVVAKREHPDFILLDVMMPGLNGYEVLKALKADPATADIPVVMLTAKASERDIGQSISMGSVRHMTKPVNPQELLEEIKIGVERHRHHHKSPPG